MDRADGPAVRPAYVAAQRRPAGISVPALTRAAAGLRRLADGQRPRRRQADPDRLARTTPSPGRSPTTTSRSPTACTPEAGPLLLYNYADYLGPGGVEGVRGEVRRRREGLDLQRHRRGDHQDPHRRRPVRHLLPQLRPDRPTRHGPARPTAQPQLSRQPRQRLVDVQRTPGTTARPRYSVPYSVYTTGIGWRTDMVPDDIAALDNPYDALWDPAVRGKVGDHRRLAHRDGHGGRCAPASPTSTPTSRGPRRHPAGPHRADSETTRPR